MRSKLAAVIAICAVLVGTLSAAEVIGPQNIYHIVGSPTIFPIHRPPFDYVVIILMENKAFGGIDGSPSASFLNELATNYTLAEQYTAVGHPSVPNYLALTGGSTLGLTTDCSPTNRTCSSTGECCPVSAPGIVDRIESAGLTWKAYMEDYPTSCGSSCSPGGCFMGTVSGGYVAKHDPFAYYSDIISNKDRCSRIVSANSNIAQPPQTDDVLLDDLASRSTASNFMWLSPGLCDDMHDCPVSSGDNYLRLLVPGILNSYLFRTQSAALFITFDEGPTSSIYPTDYVFTVWAGPTVRHSYESSNQYSHYSLLATIENAWGLKSLTPNDSNATSMTEFFSEKQAGFCLFCLLESIPSRSDFLIGLGVGLTFSAIFVIVTKIRNRASTRRLGPQLESGATS